MAETVIVQPGSQDSSSAAGWAAVAVIVIALIIGGIYVYRHGGMRSQDTGGTNINVNLPDVGGSGGDTSTQ